MPQNIRGARPLHTRPSVTVNGWQPTCSAELKRRRPLAMPNVVYRLLCAPASQPHSGVITVNRADRGLFSYQPKMLGKISENRKR